MIMAYIFSMPFKAANLQRDLEIRYKEDYLFTSSGMKPPTSGSCLSSTQQTQPAI